MTSTTDYGIPDYNIFIFFQDEKIGAAVKLRVQESDPEECCKLAVYRVRLDRQKVGAIFAHSSRLPKTQRYPFDIKVCQGDEVVKHWQNVWIIDSGYLYQADSWIIAEEWEVEAEKLIENKA